MQDTLLALIKDNGSRKELQDHEAREKSAAQDADRAPQSDFSADRVLFEENGFEVWLGGLDDALDLQVLRERNINAVLNCALEECERECAPYRSPLGGGSRRRCHARGASATFEHFKIADLDVAEAAESPTLDRDQVRSLALFDGEWYTSMLGYETAYLGIAADDDPAYSMDRHFSEADVFLTQCRAEGRKVLVHCIMGINRSTAALVAFLCGDFGMELEAAVGTISRNRGHVLSNASFLDQLITRFGLPGPEVAPPAADPTAGPGAAAVAPDVSLA